MVHAIWLELNGGSAREAALAKPRARRVALVAIVLGVATACTSNLPLKPRITAGSHLGTAAPAPVPVIPPPVTRVPVLPPPSTAPDAETYTVVVNEVPVKELLFALSRDAAVNVDVHPKIEGLVTMNAIDQTLPQILDRIGRQIGVRYEQHGDTLVVSPDLPFLRTYTVDYVNLTRETQNTFNISTQISNESISGGGGGGGGSDENNSTTEISTTSKHSFWETLAESILALIKDPAQEIEIETGDGKSNPYVIVNPEAGVVVVRGTSRQHILVAQYIDQVVTNARRQVMIQATIVEVQLNDRYRAGIDFNRLLGGGGVVAANLLAGNLGVAPNVVLSLANAPLNNPKRDTELTVRLLKEFGDVRVLSSPTVMALNNQTAVFKVVENRVFFTTEVTTTQTDNIARDTFETTPHTVPVGLVMTVTPQVAEDDEVTLSVRPTITRTIGNGVLDPNPELARAGTQSFIPEIAVREMESVLRLRSGQIAILGGLMQDETIDDSDAVPFISEIQGVGEVFKNRDQNYTKTELVIFLKPTVVRSPSIAGDLREFRRMLPENLRPAEALPTYGIDYKGAGG